MFHAGDGLYFERLEGGAVRIVKTSDAREPNGFNVVSETVLPRGAWASAMCEVSKRGTQHGRYAIATQFHEAG